MDVAVMPGAEPVEVFARLVYNRKLRIEDCPENIRDAVINNLVALGFCINHINGLLSK